ncbi:MAG: hypothetical protein C0514_05045 [Candidatus Puniceispirillum sp.]|nr:hypothetical protein [Candidatus Puniceispirillum sp.]
MFYRAWIFLSICLLTAPSLIATQGDLLVVFNDQAINSTGNRTSHFSFEVDADHMVLNLDGKKATCGFLPPLNPPILAVARDCHNYVESRLVKKSQPAIQSLTYPFQWHYLEATQEGMHVSHDASFFMRENIFCAQKDIIVSAPTLIFESTFFTSRTGTITLEAPDTSPGWMRAITFEGGPGARDFDIMLQGVVTFDTPKIEALHVLGAHKVTLTVQRLETS